MRKLLYRAIVENSVLTALIPAERWTSGLDAKPQTPFAVIRIAGDFKSVSKRPQPRAEIWIHDDRGSYVRIDQILAAVREQLDGMGYKWSDWPGELIAQIDWQSNSPDLIDDGYNTNTRMASFGLVGRSSG